jgi:hypothetical protein
MISVLQTMSVDVHVAKSSWPRAAREREARTSNQGSVECLRVGVALVKPGVVAHGVIDAQLLGRGAGGATVVGPGGSVVAMSLTTSPTWREVPQQ